jgi:hypothetical protein
MDKMEEREFSIEEFTIVELEDRLELAGRCNNCKPAAEQPAP